MEARRRLAGRALLGAGTITTPEQLAAATAAEADFLVSPHVDVPLLEAMIASGRLAIPGALTPSEVATAVRAGASVVKLFPASTVGVRHLKAPVGTLPGSSGHPDRRHLAGCGTRVAPLPPRASRGRDWGSLLLKGSVRTRAWGEIADGRSRGPNCFDSEES